MSENYTSAAARHYMDAVLLLDNNRYENAGYLAGYVVECSLKAIIVSGEGPHPSVYGHDIKILGGAALDLALLLSPAMHRYQAQSVDEILNAFRVWSPLWRYLPTDEIFKHKKEMENLVATAKKAFQEFVVPTILDGREGASQ